MSTAGESRPADLTLDERATLRDLLLDAAERARRDAAALNRDFDAIVDAAAGSNSDDEHDPEGSTIAFERAQVSSLIERALAAESAAVVALARWESGTYGRCESCDAPIGKQRLLARPATTRCIDHAGP